MNHYAATEVAEYRRQQLTSEASYYRESHVHRSRSDNRSDSRRRRPLAAFHSWVAAGQL